MISLEPEFLLSVGVTLFLAIVFLQSGLEKFFDFSGNVAYLTELFAGAPVSLPVAPLLACLAFFETAAGALSAAGAVVLIFTGGTTLAYWGAILAGASLLMVLFGQRLSKAYGDAAVIAPYFLVSCLGIHLLGN